MASYIIGQVLTYCYQSCRSALGLSRTIPDKFTGEDEPCRFPLGDDTSSTCTLPDGRKLGYAEYGAPEGKAILYFHGLPGSRKEGALMDEVGKKVNARIVATERPGIGWSSPQPGRKLLDWPKDIEALTKHLELEEYGVLGISGGGPYALACAYALPADKLKAVSIMVGLGPPELSKKGMAWLNWGGWAGGFIYLPRICKAWFRSDAQAQLQVSPEERYQLLKKQHIRMLPNADDKDKAMMTDSHMLRFGIAVTSETFAHGVDAVVEDAQVMSSKFGFRVEDIRKDLPMHLWYGKYDWSVPPIQGVQLAERLGSHADLRLCDETHGSLTYNNVDKVVEELVRTMERSQ